MYLCYVDETGNRDPRLRIPQRDGTVKDGDWLYILTAVCVYEQRWHTLEKPINRFKMGLIDRIAADSGIHLQLSDCEIKSNWLRQPRERARHEFLRHLTADEIRALSDVFFDRLSDIHARIFSVLVDKRTLSPGTTRHDIQLRSWERLLELIEQFMRARHHKHQAIMINDDLDRQSNQMLAMSHAELLNSGTKRDTWLRHICEMPMFVRSELSAGVQLADLCSYNIYRAFRDGDLKYPYFRRVAPYIWTANEPVKAGPRFSGLWVLGDAPSPLLQLVRQFEKEQAPSGEDGA